MIGLIIAGTLWLGTFAIFGWKGLIVMLIISVVGMGITE